ncbi:UDP-N-acetylmuramoyl-tripeptide--D-alanyl-D-alanine ligase [Globicatella sulfidifaciens]|uniref:UDP-N-acetylmuramoyl-tripeptide--D-alanyl-D-alanine ligase n=1 Tax=Globicatella sulfidifaciens DSM 15739 TaxID=1121925 RepID=A0A1T4KG30_9LACT|nr:UDP-N-acetylmuramoyl-tripeptide--D-alanyl-D-alanine ligase [Globicatella sulfidifaciens]SJZ41382.1 UDP-N-acetylmuramoyl-tripeptide--D-alanyl-D-alanine ligase [Globicatella sulfidifaciens DSM 15739]
MKPIKLMDVVKHVHAIDYTAKDRTISISNVEFDSRKITPGSLFVPLQGATDGHDYVEKAIEMGAVATFWSKEESAAPSDRIAIILVDDTLKALQDLSHYYRQVINPIVIGITGSNGKTTTKDMTASTLSAKYRVHKTQGNYNNEIGVPYTLLKMPEDTQVCVTEMGMSGFGEIEVLSKIAEPNIAAITLIGESHLEFLGSRKGIAQAKMEILNGLKPDGLFVYPGNEPLISELLDEKGLTIQISSFGFDSSYDVYAYDLVEEQNKTFFKTNVDSNIVSTIPVIGAYNVSNALIALTIAKHLEIPMEQAIFQLAQFELTAHRLEWIKTLNGADLLNDAYNASPTSMKAILKTLSTVPVEHTGRKIAVLGDVRELGPESANLHRSIKEAIDPDKIARVYLFGTEMKALYNELVTEYSQESLYYVESDHDELIALLQRDIQPEDVVLVKSSLGVDLLKVVTALTGHETHNMLRK